MKQVFSITILAIALLSLISSRIQATTTVEVAGVTFATTHKTGEADLVLRGRALLRYMVFIKAYAGAFYLPADADPHHALGPVPRRLELVYFHAISAADFAKATGRKVADNVTDAEMEILAERLHRFNNLYRDVQPGDRYALTYTPGQGTELELNGQIPGSIAGDDFASAIFSIWLGHHPIDRSFKNALLGEH